MQESSTPSGSALCHRTGHKKVGGGSLTASGQRQKIGLLNPGLQPCNSVNRNKVEFTKIKLAEP